MVSIIIPIYNVEKYLIRCLDSIISQTFKDIQIICIIDGSPDKSIDICRKYAKDDYRIEIINQKNCGCAKARNKALTLVRGEYLCFVDPDDYINSNYIESLYNAAVANDADIAVANVQRIKGKSIKHRTIYTGIKVFKTRAEIFRAANCPPFYAVINKMYRTKLITDGNITFETGCSWCDDVRFCVDTLLAAKCMVTVGDAIYYYIRRTGSISHSKLNNLKQLERFRIRSSAVRLCISNGIAVPQPELTVTKIVYSLFGIPILRFRVNVSTNKEYVLLLGFIPIFWRNING